MSCARSCWALLVALPAWGGTVACGGAAPVAARSPQTEPEPITTSTSIITAGEAHSAEELLDRADRRLSKKRYEEAARDYRLVVENTQKQEERLRALLGWGTALDWGGDPRGALHAYSRYVSEASTEAQRERATIRIVRLLVYLERYREAGDWARRIAGEDRAPLERLALRGALALAALEDEDFREAETQIARGRSQIEQLGIDRIGVPPLDAAAVYYALGELRRLQAERVVFEPLPQDFAAALEERCQLILDAQAAYSDAMRSQDAHWSSMSGVRVGELYHRLHEDLMDMPAPVAADTEEKRRLFEGALRLRYSILLRKSLSMMRATVTLLERTEHRSDWQKKAEQALVDIEEAHREEERAIDALPYSREQLQQVLDLMASRASGPAPAPPSAPAPGK